MKFVAFNELFKFNSWGHNRVLSAADSLTDAQLDQPIEMGPGSLRATLNHLYSAERVWLDRWKGITPPRARPDPAGVTVAKLKEELTELSAERNEFLRGKSDADLVAIQSVRNMKGEATDITLGDMLLHVINHAIHHRAQAVNMIRRVGGKPPAPGADYIFMKIEPGAEPTPPLDLGTIRAWLATADWARTRITAAAQSLTDEALDRKFDIGPGSIRRTLLHITEAEQWWLNNWKNKPETFPDFPATIGLAELSNRADAVAATRNQFLADLTDADLNRMVRVTPRPGREFPMAIGVSLLQICCHGTHHRAQVTNMLRHCGVTPPGLDHALRIREQFLARQNHTAATSRSKQSE